MKNLIIRTLSGAVYVALIVCAILVKNDFIFPAIFAVLAALATYEFHKLTNKQENVNVLAWLGAVCSFLVFICEFFQNQEDLFYSDSKWYEFAYVLPFVYIFLILSVFVIEIFRKKQNPINNIAYFLLGQIYIALPFIFLLLIKSKWGAIYLLSVFVIIWVNDTFAYLTGSTFGKHRLCERISPKKSWEGFFGGLVGALAAGFVFAKFVDDTSLWQWLVFALIIVVFGTLGDLLESLIKRTVGVKDSGNIMPGHGGFLDRLDSVIFAALPAVIFLVVLTG